jgi:hypothetical protein
VAPQKGQTPAIATFTFVPTQLKSQSACADLVLSILILIFLPRRQETFLFPLSEVDLPLPFLYSQRAIFILHFNYSKSLGICQYFLHLDQTTFVAKIYNFFIIETMYIQILIAGFGGGIIRGLVGFIKHQFSYKNVGFNLPYFFVMVFLSGIVGVLTATAINELGLNFLGINYVSPALALIIGYAGGDFLENIYKIIIKKPPSIIRKNKHVSSLRSIS